jgi:hypothetical protein
MVRATLRTASRIHRLPFGDEGAAALVVCGCNATQHSGCFHYSTQVVAVNGHSSRSRANAFGESHNEVCHSDEPFGRGRISAPVKATGILRSLRSLRMTNAIALRREAGAHALDLHIACGQMAGALDGFACLWPSPCTKPAAPCRRQQPCALSIDWSPPPRTP